MKFRKQHTFEARRQEAQRILLKYPDRIPVIVEKSEHSSIQDLDKKKYLCPRDLSVGQFIYVLRKRIKLKPEEAIFIFVEGTLPPTSSLMSTIYDKYKGDDLFLTLEYSGESTFGMLTL
jgi:GABA(A) receptor-associated protein